MTTRRRKLLTPDATPWRVVIDGKGRGTLWGSYVSRAGALAVVRQLHAKGISARVDGAPS